MSTPKKFKTKIQKKTNFKKYCLVIKQNNLNILNNKIISYGLEKKNIL